MLMASPQRAITRLVPGANGGANGSDTVLIVAATLLSIPLAAAAVVAGGGGDWQTWQWLVVLALAADLGGGMVANMLPATKRHNHAANRADWRQLAFAALHCHLPVMSLMLPASMPVQPAVLGYIWMLGSATLLLAMPHRVRLAAALGLTVIGIVLLSRLLPLDGALGWMPLMLLLKILAGHMVPADES